MTDPGPSAKFNLHAPVFDGGDAESFNLWLSQFQRYIRVTKPAEDDKLDLFLLCAGNKAAKYYNEVTWPTLTRAETDAGVTEYSRAVTFITNKFVSGKNILSERIKLYSAKQRPNQSLIDFLSELRQIAGYCNFPTAFADEALRDAFCQGLASDGLKRAVCRAFATATANNTAFTLALAVTAAEVEESALQSASQTESPVSVAAQKGHQRKSRHTGNDNKPNKTHSKRSNARCHWCGSDDLHGKRECPARNKKCTACDRVGHFAKVCLSKSKVSANKYDSDSDFDYVTSALGSRNSQRRFVDVNVNGRLQSFLIDSGSDITVITENVARDLRLKYTTIQATAKSIASKKICLKGIATATISFSGVTMEETIHIADQLCDPAIMGTNIFSKFKAVTINYGGSKPEITIASQKYPSSDSQFGFIDVEPFAIITLDPNATPIRCPTRFRSKEDNEFIRKEVNKLLEQGIIEPSSSPWRSQVVVAKNNEKRRMCIDFASTINRFTIPDAYPIPVIDNLLQKVSKWKHYSYVDLKSAYHQLLLKDDEKHLTAFEANGRLYQFRRLPFGVTNGVAAFQRAIDILTEDMPGVAANIDDIVVGGATQDEHDDALRRFMDVAQKRGLIINKEKSKFNTTELHFLGHVFKSGQMFPEKERMAPLLDFPIPKSKKDLDRFVGLAVYYSKWIPSFAAVTLPLFAAKQNPTFPLNAEACESIKRVKQLVSESALWIPDRNKPFRLETDASGTAVGGVLSQDERPVAFVSHKLSQQELNWPAVEKEAFAIVWCIDKLKHFLLGSFFTIITDQQGVAYLLDGRPKSAIKNNKLSRWRMSLAEYKFDVVYRPGNQNPVADAMSRIANLSTDDLDKPFITSEISHVLSKVHDDMGHPGIARTCEFLQRHCDIPNVKEKVSAYISNCKICLASKPRFHSPPKVPLVTSKTPWERLSIDFVGPKPTTKSGNTCFLTIVDEFSRFPFAIPMKDSKTEKVIDALTKLFTLFGPPASVHSDRGAQFESYQFRQFLDSWNVRKSRTTPYNPAGNGQCERTNGTIWKTVKLRLKQANKNINQWDEEMNFALMNIRTLACRAIDNESPHNRLFAFTRRSSLKNEQTQEEPPFDVPLWMKPASPVFVKNFVRHTKDDPLVKEARVVKVFSPQHALVSYPDSNRVDTVATKYLSKSTDQDQQPVNTDMPERDVVGPDKDDPSGCDGVDRSQDPDPGIISQPVEVTTEPRRSARIRKQKQGECGDFIYY